MTIDDLIRDRVNYFHQDKKKRGAELLGQLPLLLPNRHSIADDATIRSQVLQEYIRAVVKSQSIYYLCHEYITSFLGFAIPSLDATDRNSVHSGEESFSDRESLAHRNHDAERAFAMLREARERKATAEGVSTTRVAADRESLKAAILGNGLDQGLHSIIIQ